MDVMIMLVGALVSFGVTALLGIWMIPYLRRLKFGQTILSDGPAWHQSKQGTPVMGGLMFISGILVALMAVVAMVLIQKDNRFYEELGRFPAVEEDEPPYRLLCNEYPEAKDM